MAADVNNRSAHAQLKEADKVSASLDKRGEDRLVPLHHLLPPCLYPSRPYPIPVCRRLQNASGLSLWVICSGNLFRKHHLTAIITHRTEVKPTVPYEVEKMLAVWGRLTFAATGVCLTSSTPHVRWAGLLVCKCGRRGAAAVHGTETAFPSLVRHLDHVTPASHVPPGCPSRTSGYQRSVSPRFGETAQGFHLGRNYCSVNLTKLTKAQRKYANMEAIAMGKKMPKAISSGRRRCAKVMQQEEAIMVSVMKWPLTNVDLELFTCNADTSFSQRYINAGVGASSLRATLQGEPRYDVLERRDQIGQSYHDNTSRGRGAPAGLLITSRKEIFGSGCKIDPETILRAAISRDPLLRALIQRAYGNTARRFSPLRVGANGPPSTRVTVDLIIPSLLSSKQTPATASQGTEDSVLRVQYHLSHLGFREGSYKRGRCTTRALGPARRGRHKKLNSFLAKPGRIAVNLLASHQGDPGSIPGRVTPCGNCTGRCRWLAGFLGDLPDSPPFHSGAALYSPQSPSSALKTSMLRAVQISSLTHSGLAIFKRNDVYRSSCFYEPMCNVSRIKKKKRQLLKEVCPLKSIETGLRTEYIDCGDKHVTAIASRFHWFPTRAAVTERLDCSPPTKANRIQSPAGRSRILAYGNSAEPWRWSAGFLGDLPSPPPLHSGSAPFSPHFILIDSQNLAVKSRSNTSTQLNTC
ncbi:hypothetical protein PR048_007952 [Dryococelus australis]|uniref:Uncharacterized protein n=1 Tax=Dryococelus australis TaxID=614101 RepID=A0ABQ9HVQ4_9NEOP|nr:hypothetical protein PR048_007952 [Dryococelus australis]